MQGAAQREMGSPYALHAAISLVCALLSNPDVSVMAFITEFHYSSIYI